jgi:hypothetical protein
MTNLALLLLQVAAASGPALPDSRPPDPSAQKDCRPDAKEIVVCAKDKDAYRLPKIGPSLETPMLPKAEWKLFGNAKMNVHGEQRAIPGVGSAPAAMATITIPF